jgi:Protein of unknown function (DUF2853)
MADFNDFLPDVQRYAADADEAAVKGIVKHLGIALQNPKADSALVSCSDKSERDRVRDSWLKRKLARTESDADLDAIVEGVCQQMKADNRKQRVTSYYLAAAKLGVLESLH